MCAVADDELIGFQLLLKREVKTAFLRAVITAYYGECQNIFARNEVKLNWASIDLPFLSLWPVSIEKVDGLMSPR